ncbi:MAG TPA: hypothetical protein VKZ53_23750 [Candidatus Angelobacter sp.]|nr:hypothetical protein [Candidatus Angelobacter sp.]
MFRSRFIMHWKKTLWLFAVILAIGFYRMIAERFFGDRTLSGEDIVLNALLFLFLGAAYAFACAVWDWARPLARRLHGFTFVLRKAYQDYWKPNRFAKRKVYPFKRA